MWIASHFALLVVAMTSFDNMIEPGKLFQLEGGQKRRKLALTFGALERDILGIAEKGTEYSFSNLPRAEYIRQVAAVLLRDPKLSEEDAAHLRTLLNTEPLDELRVCNYARNTLLAILGTFPAEWDLVIAPHNPHNSAATAGTAGSTAATPASGSAGSKAPGRFLQQEHGCYTVIAPGV